LVQGGKKKVGEGAIDRGGLPLRLGGGGFQSDIEKQIRSEKRGEKRARHLVYREIIFGPSERKATVRTGLAKGGKKRRKGVCQNLLKSPHFAPKMAVGEEREKRG